MWLSLERLVGGLSENIEISFCTFTSIEVAGDS